VRARTRGWGLRLLPIWLLAAGALATGCGGSGSPHTHTAAAKPSTTSTHTSTDHPAQLRGIVSFNYLEDEDFYQPSPWKVTIYDLRRWGPYVTLDFGAKCLDKEGCDGNAFYNPEQAGGAPEDMSLIDTTNNEEYLPVTDSQGREFASQAPSAYPSTPFTLMWVTFPAPPPSVSSMDVTFREGGPEVPDVPITTAASGPTPSEVGGGAQAAPPSPFATSLGNTDTSGLNLVTRKLALKVGNPAGTDTETPGHSTITLSADVLFHFNKSNLTPKAQSVLSQVAARIKSGATGTVTVDGYTDSIGSTAYNLGLSQRRAQSVVHFLRSATAGASVSYSSQGLGEADPVAPNTLPNGADNPAGRALNRRVTISYNVKAPVKPTAPVAAAAPTAPTGTSGTHTTTFSINNAGKATYQLTVASLFRDGDMLVMRFSVKCLAAPSGSSCDGILNLAGDNSIPPFPGFKAQGGMTLRTPAAIYLQDANGTDYIPVYTPSNGQPVTAQTNQFIGTSSFPLWAYYPAPPPSVTSMTVVMPNDLSTIPDVPISNSAPPLG
jgi:OOP family OmpA-OmpF porin